MQQLLETLKPARNEKFQGFPAGKSWELPENVSNAVWSRRSSDSASNFCSSGALTSIGEQLPTIFLGKVANGCTQVKPAHLP